MDPKFTDLLSFDVETTMFSDRKGFSSATPWHSDNHILCAAALLRRNEEHNTGTMISSSQLHRLHTAVENMFALGQRPILVGHNIKFDLIYIHKDCPPLYELLVTLPIWDTMVAEYILSAQTTHNPSLHDCLEAYRDKLPEGTIKGDLLTKAFMENKKTTDLPIEDLIAYCEQDVTSTMELAQVQMMRAHSMDPALLNLIILHSTVSKVYAAIEWQGIEFSSTSCMDAISTTVEAIEHVVKDIGDIVSTTVSLLTADDEFTKMVKHLAADYIPKNGFWSSFLFGGSYEFTWKEICGEWKSGVKKGTPRFKHMDRSVTFKGLFNPINAGTTRTKLGTWSVDSDILQPLRDKSTLVDKLLTYRELSKTHNTYLLSLPEKAWYGIIHPNINQCRTHTGRLSQSSPNLQNIANNDLVKQCFVPYLNRAFVEADYKQLEMIIFAYIYRDPTLIADLASGMDVHTTIGTQLFGKGFNPELRRKVKGIVFGMIYGGGDETLSHQVGLPIGLVSKVRHAFLHRYKTITSKRTEFQALACAAAKNGELVADHWIWPTVTGRRYAIKMNKEPVPTGFRYSPHYTSMCNYPIQGMATGDIVPMMLLHVWQKIKDSKMPITLHNTVHDSILFEVPRKEVHEYAEWIKLVMEETPTVFKHWFDTEFDLRLPVSVKYSTGTWAGPWKEVNPF